MRGAAKKKDTGAKTQPHDPEDYRSHCTRFLAGHGNRGAAELLARHAGRRVASHLPPRDKAYQRLHGLVGVNVGNPRTLFTLADLEGVKEPLAAVVFELPQREIGGVLPPWNDLKKQVAYVRTRGAAVHLDGARLWESTPFYGRTPEQVSALFDTAYVSFYKGLGALAASACP